jgi:hypothetical protein
MTATQLNATPDPMEETFVTGNHIQLIEGSNERSSCLSPPYQRREERGSLQNALDTLGPMAAERNRVIIQTLVSLKRW